MACSVDFGSGSCGNRRAISNPSPTVKAEVLWGAIPARAKDKILKNVFCGQSRTSVEIVDSTKKERRGELLAVLVVFAVLIRWVFTSMRDALVLAGHSQSSANRSVIQAGKILRDIPRLSQNEA